MPAERDAVDTVGFTGAAAMVMVSDFAADVPAELVAVTEKVKVPVAVGVPVILPAVDRLSPPGRLPDALVQVMVPPPVAARVWL